MMKLTSLNVSPSDLTENVNDNQYTWKICRTTNAISAYYGSEEHAISVIVSLSFIRCKIRIKWCNSADSALPESCHIGRVLESSEILYLVSNQHTWKICCTTNIISAYRYYICCTTNFSSVLIIIYIFCESWCLKSRMFKDV